MLKKTPAPLFGLFALVLLLYFFVVFWQEQKWWLVIIALITTVCSIVAGLLFLSSCKKDWQLRLIGYFENWLNKWCGFGMLTVGLLNILCRVLPTETKTTALLSNNSIFWVVLIAILGFLSSAPIMKKINKMKQRA